MLKVSEDPAKSTHFTGCQVCASEDASEHEDGVFLFFLIVIGVVEDFSDVAAEVFKFVKRCGFVGSGFAGAGQFIGHHADGMRDVHDGVDVMRRDRRDHRAGGQFFVAEAVVFAAEKDGCFRFFAEDLKLSSDLRRKKHRRPDVVAFLKGARAGRSDDDVAAFNGFFDCPADARVFKHVFCMGRHRLRFDPERARVDERQIGEAEILHHTGDRSDVSFIHRLDEDDPEVRHEGLVIVGRVRIA